jgi:hypothetical protein
LENSPISRFSGGYNLEREILHFGFLLYSQCGNQPFYAWLSFCYARETLEGGLWWRVGNGESIKVWKDKWLPSSSTP